ncbi:hypothetical protein ACFQZW_13115 [Lutibacter aestuarii]|uniref:Cardiolipin synthase N-terminal domain-containing protein n=1 Tax=Lutibacter aestuarii TaxID=861111 RepID=A0ABW2Z8V0_9FLAO
MKFSTKFWLTIFTFLPIVFIILIFIFFFSSFLENIIALETHQKEFPIELIQSFIGFFILIILTALVSIGFKIYYIVHTNNNPTNDTNKKIMWTLILIFGGTVASIVYYFIEITPLKTIK